MDDKFKDVKIVISDFDGIFTDGKIEIFSDGKTSKRVDYRDLMGLAVILKRGIKAKNYFEFLYNPFFQ